MSKKPTLTPMMQQYLDTKKRLHPNTILLFRLGDFYEMFEQDAQKGSKVLGIALTKRHETPMAGIPYHAAQTYIEKLLKAGLKVAICDQVESAQPGKLVKRELTRILTPGTLLEETQLEANQNRYILSLHQHKRDLVAAWLDITTGSFKIAKSKDLESFLPVLYSIDPREIILPEDWLKAQPHKENDLKTSQKLKPLLESRPVTELPLFHFDPELGLREIFKCLKVGSLSGFGIPHDHPSLGVAASLIAYATDNLCMSPENIRKIELYQTQETLLLDPVTQRSLEVFKTNRGYREGSLLSVMDNTVTAAGARLLESFLSTPPLDLTELKKRQQCVKELIEETSLSRTLKTHLQQTRDLVRIVGRLQNKIRNPRELGAIRDTLRQLPHILTTISQFNESHIPRLGEQIQTFDSLTQKLEGSLEETLPNDLNEGGYIKTGVNATLDEYRYLMKHSKEWLISFEQDEQNKTSIKNLKVKYNNAYGYFIEVTKPNIKLVPDHYMRRQTMTNAQRYTTQELKQQEKEILHAQEKALAIEKDLFKDLVALVILEADALYQTANALAQLDVFIGWAEIARTWDYCCPELNNGDEISIQQGRHPVVEQMLRKNKAHHLQQDAFVPNDTLLSCGKHQIGLITGPNMAGKSTYIRQVALITLMAQIGSWVPASVCKIGLIDKIFARIGANDEIAQGHSTFMVEMSETANILNNATDKSLIILDEIGRGTSTYDGLSIAWAIAEFIHGNTGKGPKTLFATHYHELTQLSKHLPRLKNYCVSVKEWNDEIIFVRQVIEGAADRSYGIHVARLAGLPTPVLRKAQTILDHLEGGSTPTTSSEEKPRGRDLPKAQIPESAQNTKQLEFAIS